MSSISTVDHLRHCKLHQLPVELVVHIMKASPSLSTLWSFINAKAHLAAIFRASALEITEAVLQRTVPDQTQVFIRAVIQLRSSLFPLGLDAARRPATLGTPLGLVPATTPEILRSIIQISHRIHALAHECIEHYVKTCMAMNPSCLDDPTFRGYHCNPPLQPHLIRPKGRPYQPKDTGAPSWAEEQLVIWNLWRVQYYYDIRAAHDAGRLDWPVTEQEELLSMTLPEFYRLYSRMSYKREQLLTVFAYIQRVKSPEQQTSRQFCLPCPTAFNRFDWECSPESSSDQPDGKAPRLDFRPESWVFAGLMSRDPKGSPLYGFSLSHFRKFGFALWETRRMVDLGLLPSQRAMPSPEYYFRWRSILSEKECDPANSDFNVMPS